MRSTQKGLWFIASLVLLVLAGCTSVPYGPTIDPSDFSSRIDNPYMPLEPGARFIYEGVTEEGEEHIEVVVLRETRDVVGVQCVVVRDTVWANGELVEDTYDWYAQDKDGNVWYFGEDSKEYKDGKEVSMAGSWESGVDGAQPGIIMPANPTVGESYRQEYYAGEAEDMAEVVALDESVATTFGSFAGCLKTLEWTPLDPSVAEYKYYARGIGVVLETVRGSRERIELVEITKD